LGWLAGVLPVAAPAEAVAAVSAIPELPAFVQGGKTVGVSRTSAGDLSLESGWAGPAADIPRGTSGFGIVTRTDVEDHAAAVMQQQGLSEGTLFINNPTICSSCTNLLPCLLPSGAQLNVITSNGSTVFVGVHP